MKFRNLLTAGLLGLAAVSATAQPANRVLFNEGWTFEKDGASRVLDLPHDWGVEGEFNQAYPGETGKLPWWGNATYSKELTVTAEELGKSFYLDIDGAMSGAKVWCNGQFVMEWPYGYASFRANLTPFLKEGVNRLAVTLENKEDSSRWYPGGGIYRNVWLTGCRRALGHLRDHEGDRSPFGPCLPAGDPGKPGRALCRPGDDPDPGPDSGDRFRGRETAAD